MACETSKGTPSELRGLNAYPRGLSVVAEPDVYAGAYRADEQYLQHLDGRAPHRARPTDPPHRLKYSTTSLERGWLFVLPPTRPSLPEPTHVRAGRSRTAFGWPTRKGRLSWRSKPACARRQPLSLCCVRFRGESCTQNFSLKSWVAPNKDTKGSTRHTRPRLRLPLAFTPPQAPGSRPCTGSFCHRQQASAVGRKHCQSLSRDGYDSLGECGWASRCGATPGTYGRRRGGERCGRPSLQ